MQDGVAVRKDVVVGRSVTSPLKGWMCRGLVVQEGWEQWCVDARRNAFGEGGDQR